MKKWHEYIRIEDLPNDYQLIARAIGLEATIKLSEAIPKVYFYLKDPERLFMPAKRLYIQERHKNASPQNPFDVRIVALEASCSVDFVYKTIRPDKDDTDDGKQCELGL